MAGSKTIAQPVFHQLVRGLFFLVLFLLPWIDRTNISTLLLLVSGALVLADRSAYRQVGQLPRQPLFILMATYYLFYLVAWIMHPADALTQFAVVQKASFLVIFPFLFLLIRRVPDIWEMAVRGLIAGTVAALLCCLAYACLRYRQGEGSGVFFYHSYVSPMRANAIYISLYVLISVIFLVRYLFEEHLRRPVRWMIAGLLVFLIANLLLLSSKLLIAAGLVLVFLFIYQYLRSRRTKVLIGIAVILPLLIVFTTNNQIRERYAHIAWKPSKTTLTLQDYSEVRFDGLDLRLLLWRIGAETVAEHQVVWTGLGGKYYHYALNEKMIAYKFYPGFLNYDLHNQYMESYVGFGIPGLLLFTGLVSYLIFYALRRRNKTLLVLSLLFSVSFLTESLLENQAGILLFTIIISGEWIQRQPY